MKVSILLTILLLGQLSFGQESRKELAQSKIYLRASSLDQKYEITGLQVRIDLKDTLIENRSFLKFRTEDFVDYANIEETAIFFESFEKGNYTLLDRNFETVHHIDYTKTEDQTAILFGNQVSTSLEYVHEKKNLPGDSLIPNNKTPRKYYAADNSEIYAVIIPDLKTVAVSSNGAFYTKQLLGEPHNDISEGLKDNLKASSRFAIEPGDEIQLFYRRKWYNDSTGLAEYQDKQYKNVRYLGDTTIEGSLSLKMMMEGYNYLSGSTVGPEVFLIPISDSGYYYGNQFFPFKDYGTELKLMELDGKKGFFLQGLSKDTIDGFSYEKIAQANSGPFRYFILPFFPMPYMEFGNVQGIITYSKIKGVERGAKRERRYITDESNIRSIYSISANSVVIDIYFLDQSEVELIILDNEQDEAIGSLKTKSKKGLNSFTVKTENLEKGKSYRVQISYQGESNSGEFEDSFKSKH